MYKERGYLVFRNFNNLFGQALVTGAVVVSNAPAADPRSGGRPPGHPPMHSFLGVPILARGRVTGLVALANRADGYGTEERDRIETLVQQTGGMCEAYRHRERALVEAEERRRAEAALQVSEERLRLVARATNDAVWDWLIDTDRLFLPEGFDKLFEETGPPIEVSIAAWYRRIHPEDLESVMASLHAALDGDAQSWTREYRFERTPACM